MKYFIIYVVNEGNHKEVTLKKSYDNYIRASNVLLDVGMDIIRSDGGERQTKFALQNSIDDIQNEKLPYGLYIVKNDERYMLYEKIKTPDIIDNVYNTECIKVYKNIKHSTIINDKTPNEVNNSIEYPNEVIYAWENDSVDVYVKCDLSTIFYTYSKMDLVYSTDKLNKVTIVNNININEIESNHEKYPVGVYILHSDDDTKILAKTSTINKEIGSDKINLHSIIGVSSVTIDIPSCHCNNNAYDIYPSLGIVNDNKRMAYSSILDQLKIKFDNIKQKDINDDIVKPSSLGKPALYKKISSNDMIGNINLAKYHKLNSSTSTYYENNSENEQNDSDYDNNSENEQNISDYDDDSENEQTKSNYYDDSENEQIDSDSRDEINYVTSINNIYKNKNGKIVYSSKRSYVNSKYDIEYDEIQN